MDGFVEERRRTTALALALSAGLHLIVLLTLNPSPGAWRHGLVPALSVVLRPPPAEAADLPTDAPRPAPAADLAPVPQASASADRPQAPAATGDAGGPAPQAQAGASVPVADRYFKRSEVDTAAEALVRGPLVFPENALLWRLAGTVRARVFISETGTVDSVQIVEARPQGHFEEAAYAALRQVRYQPAMLGGRPVKSQKLIEVNFDPYEGSAQAPRTAQ